MIKFCQVEAGSVQYRSKQDDGETDDKCDNWTSGACIDWNFVWKNFCGSGISHAEHRSGGKRWRAIRSNSCREYGFIMSYS